MGRAYHRSLSRLARSGAGRSINLFEGGRHMEKVIKKKEGLG